MSEHLPDTFELGASGEQAWQALRQHTEWAEGFWIAWLFTGSPPLARELEARMARLLAERGQQQVVLRPRTPAEARGLLEALLGEETRTAGCVWVEIIHGDGIGLKPDDERPPGPWTEAWDWLMMRANERRTALERHLPGGVVFVAPPEIKDRARRAAPDLWTVRALVLEPAPPAMRMAPVLLDMLTALPEPAQDMASAPDVDLALAQAARMHAQGHHADEATALIRAAQGLMARGGTAEALRHASEAVEAAGEDMELRARALAVLGEVEVKHGDPVAAERHLRAALDLTGNRDDRTVQHWMGQYMMLLGRRNAWEDVERICEEQAARVRARLHQQPNDPEILSDLMVMLYGLGTARFQQHRLAEAEVAFEEALAPPLMGRHFTSEGGFALSSILASDAHVNIYMGILEGLGTLRFIRGDLDGAERVFRVEVAAARELWASRQGTDGSLGQWAIRLLFDGLSMLGQVLAARGELEEAEQVFREALALRDQVHGIAEHTSFVLALRDMASIAEARGSITEALAFVEEALTLIRCKYQDRPVQPGNLAMLRRLLETVARLRRAAGDEAGARAAEVELEALPEDNASAS